MKSDRKFEPFLFLTVMACFLLFSGSAWAKVTLKFAHVVSDPHPWFVTAEKWKKQVETQSKGEIEVTIFPAGQLGNLTTQMEGVRLGSIDLTIIGTGVNGPTYVPESAAPSLPNMFKDKTTAYRVLDGPIGQEIADLFEKKGFTHLGYWEVGLRHLTNNKRAINRIEDVRGLKIRIIEAKHWEYVVKAWGAVPVYVTWTELFSAIQQGVADAQENPIPSIFASKVYEVQKHLALTGHSYDAASVIMNPKRFKSLTQEQQKVLVDSTVELGKWQRQYIAEVEDNYLKKMQDAGIQVSKPDLTGFVKASQSIYDKLGDICPMEFIKKVQAAAQQ